MCDRPRRRNYKSGFVSNRLQFQPSIQPYIQQRERWKRFSSSMSSFQSRLSKCKLQPSIQTSFRRSSPAFLICVQGDETTPAFVASNKFASQPIVTNGTQKTASGESDLLKNSARIHHTRKSRRKGSLSKSPPESSRIPTASKETGGTKLVEQKQTRLAFGSSSQTANGKAANGRHGEMHARRVILEGSQSERNEIMQMLRQGRMSLSLHELNDIVTSLTRQKRYTEALSVVELTERKPLSDLLTISKSVKAYTIMIDLYGRAGKLDRAFSVFRNMLRRGVQPNVVTYNAMIAACSRNQEPDLATDIFEEMKESGLKPDKFTFGTLIDLSAKRGNVELAFDLSRQMSVNGVTKDQTIFAALMEACGRAGQLDRAFQVYESMKMVGIWPNMVVFSVLIDICATARNPERAFHLFAEARHWGYSKPNVIVYTALIDACAKGGWPEKAELVLNNMIEEEVKPNHITFGTLIDGWSRKGEFDRAFDVLRRMEIQHNVKPNAILIGGLIDACRRYRQCTRVKKLWNVIVRYNIKPSRLYYPGLIGMAVSAGELQVASAIALHAYARGFLRRVSLNGDVPALHAIACALIYLRHELNVNDGAAASEEKQQIAKRLHVVYESVPMTNKQMEAMSVSEARDFCISWGDPEDDDNGYLTHRQRPLKGRAHPSQGARQRSVPDTVSRGK